MQFNAIDIDKCRVRIILTCANVFLHNIDDYLIFLFLKGNKVFFSDFEIIEGLKRVDHILIIAFIHEGSLVKIREADNANTVLVQCNNTIDISDYNTNH